MTTDRSRVSDEGALRVAMVTDTMVDARHVAGLAERLRLTVIHPASLPRVTNVPHAAPVDVVALPGRRSTFPARVCHHLIRNRRRFDVVLAVDDLTAALGPNVAQLLGGPPVVLLMGRPVLEYLRHQARPRPAWVVRYLLAWALVQFNDRCAAAVDAVSRYVAEEIRPRNGRVRAIPWYGVDVELFSPEREQGGARRELGLPEDGAVVLYRSRIAAEKDPETFVAAIAILRAGGRPVVGVYQGGEHATMRAVAERLGVDIVTADRVDDLADMVSWYRAADVVVQTSHAEGLGMSPLEAMACGTPVVVSDVGGLPEVADGGRAGILVPPGDPAALASAIAGLLDDPARRADLGRRGRAHVIGSYRQEEAFRARIDLLGCVARDRRRDVDRRP